MRYIFILITLLLNACECHYKIEGKVISSATGLPIENVQIKLVNKIKMEETDDNGIFKLNYFGGCFDPRILISKEGYKPFEIEFSSSNNHQVYKVKSEDKWIDYNEPLYPDSLNKNTYFLGTWINLFSHQFSVEANGYVFFLEEFDENSEVERIKEKLKTSFSTL